MLPKRNLTIFDAPLGYVRLYTYFFTLSNLRIPLPEFFFEVLNYFKMHISCFNPFGLSKLTTFAVMCKAYNSEPNLDLLRAFLNLGPTGNWLTLSNRVPSKYPELFLEDNKLDKKSFKDVIPQHVQDDPVYNLIATYPVYIWTFLDLILYLACLKTSWEHTPKNPIIYYHREDFRSFMMEGVDGEFHFSPEGGVGNKEADSPSMIFINNETLKDEVILIDRSVADKVKKRKMLAMILTSMSSPAKELKDSADCHSVMAHVTPPSWKQRLKDIILKKICDIHDKAYMRQVVLDNVMNKRTGKLMSIMLKAKTTCDAISKREKEKGKGQVDKLHGEYSRLVLEEKKWVNYEHTLVILHFKVEGLQTKRKRLKKSETQMLQEINELKQDRVVVVVKVVPHVATELVHIDEMGLLVSHLVKIALVHDTCSTFEEASDNLATPSYPFLTDATTDSYASLEILLSKKHRSIRSKSAPSQSKSKPSSSKVPNPDN
ncbi:hypothetical protein Tco_0005596 [Tanacetum coccineum]